MVLLFLISPAAALSLVPLVWYMELQPLLRFFAECVQMTVLMM